MLVEAFETLYLVLTSFVGPLCHWDNGKTSCVWSQTFYQTHPHTELTLTAGSIVRVDRDKLWKSLCQGYRFVGRDAFPTLAQAFHILLIDYADSSRFLFYRFFKSTICVKW